MKTKLSIVSLAVATCLCLATGAHAAEKKDDQKVSVTIKKSSAPKSGYYLTVEFDYFHSKIVSGPGVISVKRVGSKGAFVSIKSEIQQTASDSFGGIANSKTGEWKKSSDPGVFKKLVCGQKVSLAYTLMDTKGMKAKFRTSKTIVKQSPARSQLRAKICPQGLQRKLLKHPIKITPKKRRVKMPGNP